jgi:hypothetical protein
MTITESKAICLNGCYTSTDHSEAAFAFDSFRAEFHDEEDKATYRPESWAIFKLPPDQMLQFFACREHLHRTYFESNTFTVVLMPSIGRPQYHNYYHSLESLTDMFRQLKDVNGLQYIKSLHVKIMDSSDYSLPSMSGLIEMGENIVKAGIKPECVKVTSKLVDYDHDLEQPIIERLLQKAIQTGLHHRQFYIPQEEKHKHGTRWVRPYWDLFDDGEVVELIGGDEGSQVWDDLFFE